MNSIFLPVSTVQAEDAINELLDELVGFELIPIPALGGCVVAIKELATDGSRVLHWLHGTTRKEEAQRILNALEATFLPDDAA